MADDRKNAPYAGGRFTLELDGKNPVGFVTSIDGGHFKSDVVTSMLGGRVGREGGDVMTGRFPGKPKYDDIGITVGAAMSPAFWKWVQATINNKPERRNGALVGYDFNKKERTRRTFSRALISEIQFPALDAAAKQGALLTIKIAPEKLEYKAGDGSSMGTPSQSQNEARKQKLWLSSNFRFELDRFKGDPSLRNAKVEAFTIKQNVIVNPVGSEREARKEPGRVELPQLIVTFPESAAAGWMKWYDETVVKGVPKECDGVITYLDSDLNGELMKIELTGVGLLSLEVEKYEASKESIARVKATLYVEGMKLSGGEGTT
jgi:phage tail-like protein